MAKINLRDFYPFSLDCIVDVPDEVAAALREAERLERNYIRRMYWTRRIFLLTLAMG